MNSNITKYSFNPHNNANKVHLNDRCTMRNNVLIHRADVHNITVFILSAGVSTETSFDVT